MARKKAPVEPSPDKLIRDEPRHYHSADGRFDVQAEPTGAWYLTDAQSTNELGLPRLLGPFATLDAVRDAVRAAQAGAPQVVATGDPPVSDTAPATPARRPKLRLVGSTASDPSPVGTTIRPAPVRARTRTVPDRAAAAAPAAKRSPPPAKPPVPDRAAAAAPAAKRSPPAAKPPVPTWLDRLEPRERTRARELIAALDGLAIVDAESIVRADLGGSLPRVATAMLLSELWAEDIAQWSDEAWVDDLAGARTPRGMQRDAADALARLLDAGAEPSDLARLATLIAARTAGLVLERVSAGGSRRGVADEIPGARLVETDHRGKPTGRALAIGEDEVMRAAPPAAPDGA